jgi:hypothetical protein
MLKSREIDQGCVPHDVNNVSFYRASSRFRHWLVGSVDAIRGLLSKVDEEETIAKSVVSPPSMNAWSADVRGEVVLDY